MNMHPNLQRELDRQAARYVERTIANPALSQFCAQVEQALVATGRGYTAKTAQESVAGSIDKVERMFAEGATVAAASANEVEVDDNSIPF